MVKKQPIAPQTSSVSPPTNYNERTRYAEQAQEQGDEQAEEQGPSKSWKARDEKKGSQGH